MPAEVPPDDSPINDDVSEDVSIFDGAAEDASSEATHSYDNTSIAEGAGKFGLLYLVTKDTWLALTLRLHTGQNVQ